MIKNGLYNSIGAIVRLGLAIVSVPALIHFIGVSEYGLWSLISSALMIVTLAEAGLATSTTIFIAKDLSREDYEGISQALTTIVALMLLFATIAAISLWLGANTAVNLFSNFTLEQNRTAVGALRIGAVSVWAMLLQQIFVGIGQAFQRYDLLNKISVLHSILNYSGLILISWLGGKSIALAQWQALENCSVLVIYFIFGCLVLRNLNVRISFNYSKTEEVLKYSLKTWMAVLGSRLFSQGDRIIIGYLLGTNSLGIYSAIINITTLINTFSALPIQPLVPKIAGLLEQKPLDLLNVQKLVKTAFQVNAFISISIASILVLLSPEIVALVIPGQTKYIFEFCVAVTIYATYSLNAVGYYLSFSMNKVNLTVIFQLVGGITSLSLIALGGIHYGLIGVIIGNIGYILILGLSIILFSKLNLTIKESIFNIRELIIGFLMSAIITSAFSELLYVRATILIVYINISGFYILNAFKQKKSK